MIERVFTYLKKKFSQTLTVVHVDVNNDEINAIYYLIVSRKKTTVTILEKKQVNNIVSIPTKYPVVIVLTARKIIHHTYENTQPLEISEILPVANINTIQQFHYRLNDHWSGIVLARPQFVEVILKQLTSLKIAVFNIYTGVFPVFIAKQLQDNLSSLEIPFYQINLPEKTIIRTENNNVQQDILLDDINIPANYLLPYSTALWHWFLPENYTLPGTIKQRVNNSASNRIIKTASAYSILFFLILLLVNTFIFTNQNRKNQQLKDIKQQFQIKELQYYKLKQQVDERNLFLKTNNITLSNDITYYIDQIVRTTPDAINLTLLEINPVAKKIKPDKSVEFSKNTIFITGEEHKEQEVINWIQVLEQIPRIKQIQLVEYEYNYKKFLTTFKLKIVID